MKINVDYIDCEVELVCNYLGKRLCQFSYELGQGLVLVQFMNMLVRLFNTISFSINEFEFDS